MPLEVAKFFFENHPKNPLTSLKSLIRQEWGDNFERKSEFVLKDKIYDKGDPLELNDPSVDISNLSREEILSKLGSHNTNSDRNNTRKKTKDLKRTFERKIKVSHPIHKYLSDLRNNDIKLIFCKILEMNIGLRDGAKYDKLPTFERMRFKISKAFFQIYPKCPMTSLKRFVENYFQAKLYYHRAKFGIKGPIFGSLSFT